MPITACSGPRTGTRADRLVTRHRSWAAPLLLAAALSAGPPAWAKDDLVIGVSQYPSTLHPDIDPEAIKAYVQGFALRAITAFDKDWHNTCLLCAELPSLQNGMAALEGQGMRVRVVLRPGLAWGDGVPLTVRDLVFTWQIGRDPASGFADGHGWQRITAIDVIDDQTAVMHLSEVSSTFDRLPGLLPEHIEAPVRARAASPADYVRQTTYARAPTTPGLYNGPYRVTGYDGGSQVVLEPNPFWSGRKPAFRRIVLRAIENTAALESNLLSGDVDMTPGDAPGLSIDQVLALRKAQPDRFTYLFRPALTYEHIDIALDNPILADVRVRRALVLASDRFTMVARLFEGQQPVAASFVNPLDPMFAPDIKPLPYDPKAARALLAEAGWRPGADGICRNHAGERLRLEFATTAGNRLRELQQQVLQNQWRAVGIDVTVHNEPARTFFGDTLKRRAFAGLAMYAWSNGVSVPPRQMLGADMVPSAANSWGGSNYTGFRDEAMEAAIRTAETALDPAEQRRAWDTMQRIYAERIPVLPLFFRSEAYVLPKWLTGLQPTGHNDYSSNWVEEWGTQ
jgi:peptide/nickel transport system substrate-binding protein